MAEDDDLPSTRQWAAHHNTANQTCNLVRRQHHYANNEQWLKPDLDQKSRRQYHQTPTSLGTPNIQSTPSHQSVPYCPPSFQFSYMHALNYHPSDSAYGHHNYQDTNKHYYIIMEISRYFTPWQPVRLSVSKLYRRMLISYSEEYDWDLNIELENIFTSLELRYLGKLSLNYG